MTPALLPPLRLSGARVLRDGALRERSLGLAGGRIVRGPLPELALPGCLILPGIVDLHAGAAEGAAAAGVTTAWVAQDWTWEGGARALGQVEAAIARLREAPVDLRTVLRAETTFIDGAEGLVALMRRHGIGQVVFRDGLSELADFAAAEPRRFAARATASGQTVAELRAAIAAAKARELEVPRHLCRLAETFDALGVLYGSIGDPDAETRERYAMIGARLAVFPASRRVAAAAQAMGDPVILSAGDVAAERVTALDLVREGLCTALASGRGWGAMAAAWRLVDRKVSDLAQAWALVSSRPAELARLPDRGRLEPGRRADLVVVREATRQVEATVSGGRLAHAAGEAGARLRAAAGLRAVAAE
jgi:alpha-D-ribose 1-methylphosphonate 5-triphosphate diphosphatase